MAGSWTAGALTAGPGRTGGTGASEAAAEPATARGLR